MAATFVSALAVLGFLLCVEVAVSDTRCRARSGTCQSTSIRCSGNYVSNLCNGPSTRRCCTPTYNDRRCRSRSGTCQLTSTQCRGGSYVSGLCGGPSNRRCCVRRTGGNTGGGGSCTAEQKRLACDLFRSSNVQAAQRHPSGQRDNAYPYNNLRDMCNGGKASRSRYHCTGKGCNAPGGSTCLSTKLLKYLVNLKSSGRVIINELAGACHSCQSRHYSGLAVDLHNDRRTSEYLRKCTQMGGWGQNEGSHVHCQFYDGRHPNW
ncbi:uncharacterized protein [Littorina saxatilis]|uniref:uncharacterized protein n=1 Tax=Littorina saxatilis TaxID=31220 RepID=UPI0038B4333A